MDPAKIRKDFPVLERMINSRPIIYFDNACMAFKPLQVVDAMNDYYMNYPACGKRSEHALGREVGERIDDARKTIAKFIGAKSQDEIIFTKNTTESINLVANAFDFSEKESVLITEKEHNSNLLPWLRLKGMKKFEVNYVSFCQKSFDMDEFEKKVRDAGLVSMVHTSNMDGSSIDPKEIIRISHKYGVPVMLDAAQSVPHKAMNVRRLDVDFLAFSGHKMLGPTGTGILYCRQDMQSRLGNFIVGGGTVEDSTYTSAVWHKNQERFEAGLQDYAGMIGLAAAARYLMSIGMDEIEKHEIQLNKRASTGVLEHGAQIIGPGDAQQRSGIISFNLPGMDPHSIAIMLDHGKNIMIRSGRHCVHSWFNSRNMQGSARASFYVYNTQSEIDDFIIEIGKLASLAKSR